MHFFSLSVVCTQCIPPSAQRLCSAICACVEKAYIHQYLSVFSGRLPLMMQIAALCPGLKSFVSRKENMVIGAWYLLWALIWRVQIVCVVCFRHQQRVAMSGEWIWLLQAVDDIEVVVVCRFARKRNSQKSMWDPLPSERNYPICLVWRCADVCYSLRSTNWSKWIYILNNDDRTARWQ